MPSITGIQDTTQTGSPSSLDMKSELATIQALSAGQAPQGSGFGQTLGQLGGTGMGAAFGSPEIGAAAGGTAGSLVDWFINKNAGDNTRKRELTTKRKLLDKAKRKGIADATAERRANIRGIALSEEQQAMTKEDMAKNERERLLTDLMADLQQKEEFQQYLTNDFLKKRKLT